MNSSSENFSEILIVGGGVIGLALARELHRRGLSSITVLERGAVGREASHAAAGMLSPQAETDRLDHFFDFCRQSNGLYPDLARRLLEETRVDIELDRSGTLYLAFSERDVEEIRRRFEWQTAAGLEVKHLSARETRQTEPFVSPDVLESLFFPNDWQVENRRLVRALQKYAELAGIKIRENTAVRTLLLEHDRVAGAATETKEYFAQTTVLATGAWTSLIDAKSLALPPVKPIRGQMISFQTAKRLFQKVIYTRRGYLVPRRDGRLLIGATIEDVGFDRNTTAAGADLLRETAFEIAPSLGNLEVAEQWSGLRPFAPDGLPVIGELPGAKDLLIATAHYRNGILLAPATAEILADRITDRVVSDYLEIFSPQRFLADEAQKLNTTV